MKRFRSVEYRTYCRAKERCQNENLPAYRNYGGRGIQFLFESFAQFFQELGLRPEGKTLDRKDNNGHYEPGNVRWATQLEQNNNRRPYPKNRQRRGRGYSWHKRSKRWIAKIKIGGAEQNLGSFTTEQEASVAYQTKLKELAGGVNL